MIVMYKRKVFKMCITLSSSYNCVKYHDLEGIRPQLNAAMSRNSAVITKLHRGKNRAFELLSPVPFWIKSPSIARMRQIYG